MYQTISFRFQINQEVQTPVGPGVVQAAYKDGRALVRVMLNGSVQDKRCMTPHAVKSSLWEFGPDECTSIRR